MSVIGARRALHLSRHLPAEGWRPVVCASEPLTEGTDEPQRALIGAEAVVSRTYTGKLRAWLMKPTPQPSASPPKKKALYAPAKLPTLNLFERLTGWSPQYLSPFDKFILDVPHATRAALKLAREHAVEAVVVSADPWSALITGARVSARLKVPLIVDFRDPWTLHQGKRGLRPRLTLALMRAFERWLFRRASGLILNTEAAREAYLAAYPQLNPERVSVARNAFDESMFIQHALEVWAPPPPLKGRAFELVYFGKFRRFVRPDDLMAGLARAVEREGLTPERFKLVMISGVDRYLSCAIERLGLERFVEAREGVSFADSVETLQKADALALTDGGCPLVIPGKLYDYLLAGRPILCVSESEEVRGIIEQTGAGLNADAHNPDAIANALMTLITRAERGEHTPPNPALLEPFSARAQAARYAEIVGEAVARYPTSVSEL